MGLPESPEGLTRTAVDGDHGSAVTHYSVDDAIHIYGFASGGGGIKVVTPPGPRYLQILEIPGVDLI
jgi:hypothetical protein